MLNSYLTSLTAIEPRIEIPSFIKPKAANEPLSQAQSHRLSRIDHFDRYLRLLKHNNDQWLRTHGKSKYSGFSPAQRQQMKRLFEELDADQVGAVTLDELMEPLFALGVVKTKEEVHKLFHRPMNDPNPVVDFEEFHSVLEAEHISHSRLAIQFRHFLRPSPLPFKVRISSLRRKAMLEACTSSSPAKKESARAVMRLLADTINSPKTPLAKGDMLVKKKLSRGSTPRRAETPRAFYRVKTATGVRSKLLTAARGLGKDLNSSGLL